MTNLIGSQKTLDTKMAASKLTLFTDSNPVTSEDVAMDTNLSLRGQDIATEGNLRVRRRAVHLQDMDDDDEDDDEDEEEDEEDDEDDEDEDDEEMEEADDEWTIADDKVST